MSIRLCACLDRIRICGAVAARQPKQKTHAIQELQALSPQRFALLDLVCRCLADLRSEPVMPIRQPEMCEHKKAQQTRQQGASTLGRSLISIAHGVDSRGSMPNRRNRRSVINSGTPSIAPGLSPSISSKSATPRDSIRYEPAQPHGSSSAT